MTDPVSKSKGFGDAALAREVIEKYVRKEDCRSWLDEKAMGLGSVHPEEVLCYALVSNPWEQDGVNPSEKEKLARAGFSDEFISELGGSDGMRIVRERVKWFADRIVVPWYRRNLPARERAGMVDEVGYYGKNAAAALPALVEILENYLQLDSLNSEELILVRTTVGALGSIHRNGGDIEAAIGALTALIENNQAPPAGVGGPKQRILENVVEVLSQLGPKAKAALPHLKRMFQERATYELTATVANIEDVETLLQDLNDENLSMRRLACGALRFAGIGNPGVVPALVEKVKTDPSIRDDALISLARRGEDATIDVPMLVKIYFDADTTDQTRFAVAAALLSLEVDRPETFSVFENYLSREDVRPNGKAILVDGLYSYGRSALPFLFQALKFGVDTSRVGQAILKIGLTEQDIEPLMEAVDEGFKDRRYFAELFNLRSAMVRIGESAALPLTRVLKKSEGVSWRVVAVALSNLGKKAGVAVPELYAIARENLEKVEALAHLDPEKANFYFDKANEIRGIFSELGREVLPLLVEGFRNERGLLTVGFCLGSLGVIGEEAKEAVPALLKSLEDPPRFSDAENDNLRGGVLDSLAKIAPDSLEVLMKITEALQDSNHPLRYKAATILLSLAEQGKNSRLYLTLPSLMAVRDNPQEKEDTRNAARDAIQSIEENAL